MSSANTSSALDSLKGEHYIQGRRAALAGAPSSSAPGQPGTLEHDQWTQGWRNTITALFVVLLAACTTIDQHASPPAGWPALTIVEHHVQHKDMRDRCGVYLPAWMSPEGCAMFKFDERECHIYVSADFPSAYVLEHERLHCKGYDHVGSNEMQQMLVDWKSRQ